jgi:hypothetical protein
MLPTKYRSGLAEVTRDFHPVSEAKEKSSSCDLRK